jgi:hypothetical protein
MSHFTEQEAQELLKQNMRVFFMNDALKLCNAIADAAIAKLEDKAGMPAEFTAHRWPQGDVEVCRASDVRAALAAMQAKVDQEKKERKETLYEAISQASALRDQLERATAMPTASEAARVVAYGKQIDTLRTERDQLLEQLAASQREGIELRTQLEQAQAENVRLQQVEWRSYKATIILANGSGMRKTLNPMSNEDRITGALECLRGEYDAALKEQA